MRARAGPGADQNIHAKIFQRGVQDFLHVGKQTVDLVDEENLARTDVGQHARQIELLLQNRGRRSVRNHAQFAGDDGGERGFPKPGGP